MGFVVSKNSDEKWKSRRIDSALMREKAQEHSRVKILLLGAADSGKSTIVKQMRIRYNGGFNDTEVINAIFQIRSNIIDAYTVISNAILDSPIQINDSEIQILELFTLHKNRIALMQESDELHLLSTFRFFNCVRTFLTENRTYPTLPDNFYYFYPQLHRILVPNYVPTEEDMIHMRENTLGVHELTFDTSKYMIKLIDVGGQRSERRKWMHFFEGVTAVMFVASLNCFDQFLEEESKAVSVIYDANGVDSTPAKLRLLRQPTSTTNCSMDRVFKNRLRDSVDLFHAVLKNNFLYKSSFVLFLNKTDLLTEKLKSRKMVDYFEEYTGLNEYEPVSKFIEDLFRKEKASDEQSIYVYFTQATETKQIDNVFTQACDIVLAKNMDETDME